MNIHLRPELEKLVEQDVQRGPYQTADEFVERAVVLLHEQESWLAENSSKSIPRSVRVTRLHSAASCSTRNLSAVR